MLVHIESSMDRFVYEKCCILTTWKFIDFHVNPSLATNGNEQFVWVHGSYCKYGDVLVSTRTSREASQGYRPSRHKFDYLLLSAKRGRKVIVKTVSTSWTPC